jgi:hypothetical protein
MDGLGDFFTQNWQKLFSGGLVGAGEVGNILEGNKAGQYQNFVMNLLKNPQLLAQMAAKIQQPLNNGLTQAVGNQVQGNLASRGLSQAPGIFAASESQALAPFYQQNQNTAMQAVLQSLGLPAGTFRPPTNLGPAMSLFLNSFKPNPAATAPTPTGVPIAPSSTAGLTWPFPASYDPSGGLNSGDTSSLGGSI